MKKIILLILILSFAFQNHLSSQIVNTINLNESENKGWSGSFELEYDYNKSTEIDAEFINSTNLMWNNNNLSLMFFNIIDFHRAGEEDFSNDHLQHFRVKYYLKDKFALESYLQNQHDLVHNIEKRKLAGLGFKANFPIIDFIGLSIFYEDELLVDAISHRDYRMNFYNELSFNISENLKFSNVIYYQPNIEEYNDYKLALESTLSFPIIKNLYFTNTLSLAHDTYPAVDIPKTTYQIKNSLKFKF